MGSSSLFKKKKIWTNENRSNQIQWNRKLDRVDLSQQVDSFFGGFGRGVEFLFSLIVQIFLLLILSLFFIFTFLIFTLFNLSLSQSSLNANLPLLALHLPFAKSVSHFCLAIVLLDLGTSIVIFIYYIIIINMVMIIWLKFVTK